MQLTSVKKKSYSPAAFINVIISVVIFIELARIYSYLIR